MEIDAHDLLNLMVECALKSWQGNMSLLSSRICSPTVSTDRFLELNFKCANVLKAFYEFYELMLLF